VTLEETPVMIAGGDILGAITIIGVRQRAPDQPERR
jgi:hypothetical protein